MKLWSDAKDFVQLWKENPPESNPGRSSRRNFNVDLFFTGAYVGAFFLNLLVGEWELSIGLGGGLIIMFLYLRSSYRKMRAAERASEYTLQYGDDLSPAEISLVQLVKQHGEITLKKGW